jgi:CBS domain-containing protein
MEVFRRYRVGDVMTYRPLAVSRSTTLAEAARLFDEYDFHCLPVAEEGALLGVLTKFDFLRAFVFRDGSAAEDYETIMTQPVETVMTRRALAVTPQTPLTAVLARMAETRHESFPVVHDTLLLGIIARADVVRALRCAAAGEEPRAERLPGARQTDRRWACEARSIR